MPSAFEKVFQSFGQGRRVGNAVGPVCSKREGDTHIRNKRGSLPKNPAQGELFTRVRGQPDGPPEFSRFQTCGRTL